MITFSRHFIGWPEYVRQHQKAFLTGILFFFGIIYCLVSLPNHYYFRTAAYDLGIFNNAIYDYAHFRWNSNPVKLYENILGDHFTLLHLPFSLLYWIFGTYTLLVIQIAAILFGGYGAYRFHWLRTQNTVQSLLLLVQFLSIWGIYSALSYDYHDNVIAAMLVPWFFSYFHQKKWLLTFLFYALILISKENMALWAIFLNLGLLYLYFQDKTQRYYALIMSMLAGIYFIVVVKWIVPALAVEPRSYTYIQNYTALGSNFTEILQTIFIRPFYTIGLLFQNHLLDPEADGIKWELHWVAIASGGFALFVRPAYLFMLLPIYAQKLFISNFMIWGINYQYSIEFVPIINLALSDWISRQTTERGTRIAWIALLLTLAVNIRIFDRRVSKWNHSTNYQFYKAKHYRTHFNVKQAYEALKLIPANAPVSALAPFVPHLAFRDYIYEFPYLGNAQYIALIQDENPYPMTKPEYEQKIKDFRNSRDWQVLYDKNKVLILKSTKPESAFKERVTFK